MARNIRENRRSVQYISGGPSDDGEGARTVQQCYDPPSVSYLVNTKENNT